jgi:predicted amidohydrolase
MLTRHAHTPTWAPTHQCCHGCAALRCAAQEAAGRGCRALFLPECFSFLGSSPRESLAAAQPLVRRIPTSTSYLIAVSEVLSLRRQVYPYDHLNHSQSLEKRNDFCMQDGPLMARYRHLARDTGVWLSLGGFQELSPEPGKLYNCHVVLNAQGEVAATYRKVHLFDVDVPNGPVLMESGFTLAGEQVRGVWCGVGG